jgi:hypothetical protein
MRDGNRGKYGTWSNELSITYRPVKPPFCFESHPHRRHPVEHPVTSAKFAQNLECRILMPLVEFGAIALGP